MLDQHAADSRADDEGQTVAARPDAEDATADGLLGPDDADDGERRGQQQGGTGAGDDPSGDQHADAGGQRAGDRGGSQDRRTGLEGAPAAVEIGEQSAAQEQYGVGQIVAVQHPLQRGHVGAEGRADGMHGQVDHGRVYLSHQHAEAEREEDQGASVGGGPLGGSGGEHAAVDPFGLRHAGR